MRHPGPPKPRWRPRNRFTVLAQGERYFPAMLAAIDAAREAVALEMYWMESGRVCRRFVDALIAAAGRGVAVQVLIDDYGSADLDDADRRRLAGGGVVLARYNPLRLRRGRANLARDHRKLLLVDGRIGFVGGTGIADDFDGGGGWRETMLQIEGGCLADWWRLFAATFERWSSAACVVPASVRVGRTRGRVLTGAGGSRTIRASALADMARARSRVWLVTPYFLPPVRLRRALARTRHRGADVRLLLPAPDACDVPGVQAAGRRYYDWLLRRRVRVFEYSGCVLHQKVLLADDRVQIGSSNLDRWGLRWNLEAGQSVWSQAIADDVAGMLAGDFARARELRLEDWQRRSPMARLRERFWGWLEGVGASLAQRRRVKRSVRDTRPPGLD